MSTFPPSEFDYNHNAEIVNNVTISCIIESMNNSYVKGFDGLSMNMLKNCATIIEPFVRKLMNLIFLYNVVPKNFNACLIVPIKKDKSIKTFDCNNYRPLSISNVFSQFLEAYILSKSVEIQTNIAMNQYGFRNKLSTLHPLFITKELLKKSQRHRTPIYLGKLDAEKAFDFLWRDSLFYKSFIGIIVNGICRFVIRKDRIIK